MNALLVKLYRYNWIPYVVLATALGIWAVDTFMPVVSMEGKIVARAADSVDVRIVGSKLRYCKYIDIQAYTAAGTNPKRIAEIKRVDSISQQRMTRPTGDMDIGVWRIWPTAGATRVIVYTQHDCGDDDLHATKVADVTL